MKVILVEDVKKIGNAGEVVDVAAGHARNYLIPRGLAKEATQSNLSHLKHKKKVKKRQKKKRYGEAEEQKEKMEDQIIEIGVKAGDNGKLFGSVTNSDIAKALKKKGFKVDKRKIKLSDNIKQLGTHNVEIKLYKDVTATVKVKVVDAS